MAEFGRQTRQMRLFAQLPEILARVVVVGATLWIVSITLTALSNVTNIFGSQYSTSVPADSGLTSILHDLPLWLGELAQVSYSVWLGSLGVMVALWLLRRAREEPRVV